jgi:non-specific serine/threonine protein kinase/serine/threonine-protein kinase
MEYVHGVPITDYCDQKRLKIEDRLALFIKVCEALQHAHQKAIIHRDLKPANILVQEVDGKPVPRIIDFGLAKATSTQTQGETLYTHLGSFVGTPGFMSPEQCDATAHDVDTRSDVYALGVVVYVLLTGCLPFHTESPHHFVLRHRVERAKEMLRAAKTRVLDVAVACGFKTQQHFARVFRQMCRVSPTEYRQEFLRH